MINSRIYNIWSITVVFSLALMGGYQLAFGGIPHFALIFGSAFTSVSLTQFVSRKHPRHAPPVLFANIVIMDIGIYWSVNGFPMLVCILFFLPIYSLLFRNRNYYISGVLLTAIGYLLTTRNPAVEYHVIFFIMFIAYALLVGFVSQMIEKNASEVAKFREQVDVFSKTIEARDAYTQGHSRRVSLYAVEIGRLVKGIDLNLLKVAGDLHDIGKISTPDSVLLKPGRLTPEEYDIIKRHPVDGANLLRQFGIDGPILEGVLYHHERMDGSGYPEGLAGSDIPLFARILAITDTFDAMTTTRSYRAAFPPQAAYDEIVSLAGKFYDPELVECFKQAYPRILSIFEEEERIRQEQQPLLPTPTAG